MSAAADLLSVNPALDRATLRDAFARVKRLQIRDVLTPDSARNLADLLARGTPWGMAWHAGADGPNALREADLRALSHAAKDDMWRKISTAMRGSDYGFVYAQYPMIDAYLQGWAPGGPHEAVVEAINDAPFLDLVREVTGLPELVKADAQATLYAAGNFLAQHDDSHVAQGWRIAYVLNLCTQEWRPDWGGYLNFYDADGDIVAGYRPRFNALNLFLVPQPHSVSYVPPFAPQARFAITGWFRDR